MNGVSKDKKMQVKILDVPKITNSARWYEDAKRERIVAPKEVKKQLSRTAGLDKKAIGVVSFYVIIIVIVALLKVFVMYDVSSLGRQKEKKDKQLITLKKEVARLENEFVDNYELKKMESKSKEMGFIPNDSIKYIDVNK